MLRRMTIGRKLALGFGVLLGLFLLTSAMITAAVGDVDGRLSEIREVEGPVSEAAYEMEINAIGTGLAVLKYLDTADQEHRDRALDDEEDFERAKVSYDEAVTSKEGRELGGRITSLYGRYESLGEELMNNKDHQDELFKEINSNFDEIDAIVDDEIQADIERSGPDGPEKETVSSEAETNIAEVGTWFGIYLRDPKPESRQRIADNARDFRGHIRRMETLRLTDAERGEVDDLGSRFEETMGLVDDALSVNEEINSGAARFTDLRDQMDEVLDDQIQYTAKEEQTEAEEAIGGAVEGVRNAILALLFLGLLVGSGAATMISRNIVGSVRRLVEGANSIGSGALGHRIPVQTRDELGELARAFNEMAEKRQRSEEEVRRLNAGLEERVRERTAELQRAVEGLEAHEDQLKKSEERYRAVVEQAMDGIYLSDAQTGRILEANPAYQRMLGYTAEELCNLTVYDVVAHDRESINDNLRSVLANGSSAIGERKHRRKDGSLVNVEVGVVTIFYGGKETLCSIVHDVTERKRAEVEIRSAEARYRTLVEQVPAVLYTANLDDLGGLTYVSPRYERLSGYTLEDHLKDPALWSKTIHPEDRRWVMEKNKRSNQTGDPFEMEYRMIHRDGNVVWVHEKSHVLRDAGGRPLNRQGFFLDVTARKDLEAQLSYQAFHDPLTGLPNRALFMDRLEHALTRAERDDESVAVLFLDLDNFKIVNDSLGHGQGDALLVEVAGRLKECLRDIDTAARFGGDEFTILLEYAVGPEEVIGVVKRIGEALELPISVEGHEVHVSTSVGIAMSSNGTYGRRNGAETLLRDADLAMYEAKRKGKAGYEVFDPSMNARARVRLEKENDLRKALEREEIEVYYQPKADLSTGRISGFEALVRWSSPERGLVPPVEFVPLAEETGLIIPIGRRVLWEACRQTKEWQETYAARSRRSALDEPPLNISVNISTRQLKKGEHGDIVEEVEQALAATGLPPRSLQLEITESVLMEDIPQNVSTLLRLKALGVQVEIDDFGTGYSSLSYLRRFPVDGLKIDRSFVEKLGEDAEGTAIVSAMIGLASDLGLTVVAESVETAYQLERLRLLGCDQGQGYYFGRPVAAPAAEEILETVFLNR